MRRARVINNEFVQSNECEGWSPMNATVHTVKAPAIGTHRHDAHAENVALRAYIVKLELLHVSSVGLLMVNPPASQLVELHIADIRRVMGERP